VSAGQDPTINDLKKLCERLAGEIDVPSADASEDLLLESIGERLRLLLPRGESGGKSSVYDQIILRTMEQLQDKYASELEAGNISTAVVGLRVVADDIVTELGAGHPLRRDALFNLASAFRLSQQYDDARVTFEQGRELSIQFSGADSSEVAIFSNAMGSLLNATKQFEESMEFYSEAVGIFLKVGSTTDAIQSATNYARSANAEGKYFSSVRMLEKIQPLIWDEIGHVTGNFYNEFGISRAGCGDFEEGLEFFRKAISERSLLDESESVALVSSIANTARLCEIMGKSDEAKALRSELESRLDNSHPHYVSICLEEIASMMDSEEVAQARSKLIPLILRSDRKNDYVTSFRKIIGQLRLIQGEWGLALKSLNKALLGLKSWSIPWAECEMLRASALLHCGDTINARRAAINALKILTARLGLHHPACASAFSVEGAIFLATGNYDKATSSFEEALEIRKKGLGPDHILTTIADLNISVVRLADGDLEQCKKSMKDIGPRLSSLPDNHPWKLAYFNLATVVAIRSNEVDFANETAKKLDKILSESEPPLYDSHLRILNNLAYAEMAMRSYAEAILTARRAMDIMNAAKSIDPILEITVCNNFGVACVFAKRFDEGNGWFERGIRILDNLQPSIQSLATTIRENAAGCKSGEVIWHVPLIQRLILLSTAA